MGRMRRDDVADSFLYINEIRQQKSVSNPSLRLRETVVCLSDYWIRVSGE